MTHVCCRIAKTKPREEKKAGLKGWLSFVLSRSGHRPGTAFAEEKKHESIQCVNHQSEGREESKGGMVTLFQISVGINDFLSLGFVLGINRF